MIYFGVQNDTEIGPLRPIFNTPLQVAQIDMYTKTDEKPVEMFWQMNKYHYFYSFLDPKWSKNWASEVQILHTSKSTCNEHVKQY